jgi:uncharacterized RDD family membrane protein YckC
MNESMAFAGFWRRVAAVTIDGIILDVGIFLLSFVLDPILLPEVNPEHPLDLLFSGGMVIKIIIGCVSGWLYSALLESSPRQATVGKMALGIRVTDLAGNRIGFAQATGRYFAKIPSALILSIGFLMVAFTEKKQGLHDKLAGTLVVKKA